MLREDPVVPARYVLPVTAAGSVLEAIRFRPLEYPTRLEISDIDATAGYGNPVKRKVTHVLSGADGALLRLALESVSADDARRLVAQYLTSRGVSNPQDVQWRWNAVRGSVVMTAHNVDADLWEKNSPDHQMTLIAAGLSIRPASASGLPAMMPLLHGPTTRGNTPASSQQPACRHHHAESDGNTTLTE